MFVEHLSEALRLREELGAPELLGITLDVGHCVAVEPDDAATCLRRAADLLVNVQLDDMRTGVHEHLEFGEGELEPARHPGRADRGGLHRRRGGRAAAAQPRGAGRGRPGDRRAAGGAVPPTRPSDVEWVTQVDHPWLVEAEARVRADPAAIRTLFPAVGRKVGRAAAAPGVRPAGPGARHRRRPRPHPAAGRARRGARRRRRSPARSPSCTATATTPSAAACCAGSSALPPLGRPGRARPRQGRLARQRHPARGRRDGRVRRPPPRRPQLAARRAQVPVRRRAAGRRRRPGPAHRRRAAAHGRRLRRRAPRRGPRGPGRRRRHCWRPPP